MPIVFSEQTIATVIAAALTLGTASYLHQYAWDLWSDGKYEKSEALCRPVQILAKAIVGGNSPVAAGCDYYTAECLRCQGKFQDAEDYYLRVKKLLTKRLGENDGMVADTIFNLSRAYEGDGKIKEATEGYDKSVKLYEGVSTVGPDSAWLARVLDRQAMCLLKNNEPEKALGIEQRAYGIDQRYGSVSSYRNNGQELNDLGVIYFRLGRFAEAEQKFSESLTAKNFSDTDLARATTEYNLGQLFKATNKGDSGKGLIESARKTWLKYVPDGTKYKNDSELYQAVLEKTKPLYEVPNWDTRAEEIITGVGRI